LDKHSGLLTHWPARNANVRILCTGTNAASAADTSATGTAVKTEPRDEKKVKIEPVGATSVNYDLGKRHFANTAYGEFGAEGVDTLEAARKRLRAEAFGGDAALYERGLADRKVVLKKDLPMLLPPSRLAALQRHSAGLAAGALKSAEGAARAPLTVPNVTWSLLDGK
jgi:hypothetical protein